MADLPGKVFSFIKNHLPSKGGKPMTPGAWQNAAESLIASVHQFQFRPSNILKSHERGKHGRRKAGSGDSFWQFRPFSTGDSQRDIDWRRSAKSDSLYIKQREWETTETLWLATDMSGSMQYLSSRALHRKADAAAILTLAIARLGQKAGERTGWLSSGKMFTRNNSLTSLTADLVFLQNEKESLPLGISHQAKGGVAFLISDFLIDEKSLIVLFETLEKRRMRPITIIIRDPAEKSFPFHGRTHLIGLEGEEDIILARAGEIKEKYFAKLRENDEKIHRLTNRLGGIVSCHVTDDLPAKTLMTLLPYLMDRQKGAA